MTAYTWTKACPGVYYLWLGEPKQNPVGKAARMDTGSYQISDLRRDTEGPRVPRAPWTPRTAMEALERHFRKPGDTFMKGNFR